RECVVDKPPPPEPVVILRPVFTPAALPVPVTMRARVGLVLRVAAKRLIDLLLRWTGNGLSLVAKVGRLARIYATEPPLRRLLHTYLRDETARRSVSLGRMLEELLRLHLIMRLQRGKLRRRSNKFHIGVRYLARD